MESAAALQLGIADPGVFKSLFAEAGVLETHFLIEIVGGAKGFVPFCFPEGSAVGGKLAGGAGFMINGSGGDGMDGDGEQQQYSVPEGVKRFHAGYVLRN